MRKGQFDPLFVVVLVFILGMVIAKTALTSVVSNDDLWRCDPDACDISGRQNAVCAALGIGADRPITRYTVTPATTTACLNSCSLDQTGEPLDAEEAAAINTFFSGTFNKYAVTAQCLLGGVFGTGEGVCVFTEPACTDYTTYSADPNPYLGYVNDAANTDGGFYCNNEPWQCFLIFGALPFTVIYFFVMDILGFASFFSSRTRQIVALGVAAVSTMSGGLASISQQLAEVSNLGAGTSFISLVFLFGILTALIGQFTSTAQQLTEARYAKYELTEGFETMRDVGRRISGRGGG